MTAGNRRGFIIINLRACIRIYDVTLLPSVPRTPSSAPTRWRCARFLSRSAIKFIPVAPETGDARTAKRYGAPEDPRRFRDKKRAQ